MRTFVYLALLGSIVTASGEAAVLTVGPAGSYADIQTAIDDAVTMAGDDEVRVQSGTFTENLQVYPDGVDDRLVLTGSWNSTFTARSGTTTTIDANDAGRVLDAYLEGSDSLRVEGFTLTNGLANSNAGVAAYLIGNAGIEIDGNRIVANHALDARTSGGGLTVNLVDNSTALIRDNVIDGNTAESTGSVDARGGGLVVQADTATSATITGNTISNNAVSVAGGGSALAGGMDLILYGGLEHLVAGNTIIGNTLDGGNGTGVGVLIGGPDWMFRNNRIEDNTFLPGTLFASQVSVSSWSGGTGIVRDCLIAGGNGRGLQAYANDSATVNLINLTVVAHPERGVYGVVNDPGMGGMINVYNVISSGNATDLDVSPEAVTSNNVIGATPGFVDPVGGNYRLATGSPAIDAGDNSPPGGLGMADLDGHARVIGIAVDAGAYERSDTLFGDGFES